MKVSKLLVMAIVVLAVITMSLNVQAGTEELKAYVGDIHNINNMVFELTDSQKKAVLDYINTLDNATADAVLNDIRTAENLVRESGATSVDQLSKDVKNNVVNLARSAADKAGLDLNTNTADKTFSLTKRDGGVLVSGSTSSVMVPVGGASSSSNASASTGKTLLYTGSNSAVYAVAIFAIVAVAVVIKKRA